MINDLKNYKGMMIILFSLLPLGLFSVAPNISIIVISASYENGGSIGINIQYAVKNDVNISTPTSALFDVMILSVKDDSGRIDDPGWGISFTAFMAAVIHQLEPGIYSYLIEGGVYSKTEFGFGTPGGCIPPQLPSEITFVVSIGEDFYSSSFTAYLDT